MTDTYTRRTVVAAAGAAVAGVALAGCGVASAKPAPGTTLGKTSDIPVGGGKVFPDVGVVVTQPQAGTYKAFSAGCTHKGCLVNEVSDRVISCPCHLSRFAIADGSVTSGPAPSALPEYQVNIVGDDISVA